MSLIEEALNKEENEQRNSSPTDSPGTNDNFDEGPEAIPKDVLKFLAWSVILFLIAMLAGYEIVYLWLSF
ncbi:MAG: hypothetical protein ABEK50_08670 [bacterium]